MNSIDGVQYFNEFIQVIMSIVSVAVTNPTVQYITIFIIADMIFSRISFNFDAGGGLLSRFLNAIVVITHAMTVASAVLHVYRG